jgi:hypothetical protein
MSDHAWILENLAAYLADGLEATERERLEQHIAACAPCSAALSAARDVDASLSALFAQARPSAALEDRAIQTLRTRTSEASWRLPLPAWFLTAAAALLLIGVTGAVASQILVDGGLSFPSGTMASTLLGYQGEKQKAVGEMDQAIEEARESVLRDLDFYPPDQALDVKASSTIHNRSRSLEIPPSARGPTTPKPAASSTDGTSNTIGFDDKTKDSSNKPPSPSNAPGGMPSPSGGMMGMNGGLPPGWPYDAGKSKSHGQPAGYFEPGKQLQDLPKGEGEGKDQKGGDNKGPGKDDKGGDSKDGGKQPSDGGQAKGGQGQGKDKDKPDDKPPAKKPPEPAGPRKIVIRTGEVEYEVQSFDAAVATIARLVKNIKGGFVATVNSDKLANGKVRGSITVRVPPENLDELILELRTNLGKSGELKNQRIHSDDITKQYTDLESRLKAGRAMEDRLLQIIKNGKGEIKDLLAVEKELGEWRTRIEELEGSLRYYANQVALSTLTITLFEKEIQAPFGIVECENVQMGIEVEEVDETLRTAQKAVREAKGRITRSELKQPSQGQFSAILHFEVAPDAAGPLRDRLKQLGTVARLDIARTEETEGGSGKPSDGKITRKDTRFQVHFYNLTNVAPRETVQVNLASLDVEAAVKTLLARIDKAAGRILSSNLNSARGDQAQADLQFEVKTAAADAVLEDVKAAGEVMRLNVTENPDAQNTTRKKRGFRVQMVALSAAAARETDQIQLACTDVAASYRAVQEAVAKVKGRVRNAQLNEQDRRNITATLDFEVRRDDEAVLRAALTTAGDVYTRKVSRAADSENVVDSKVHWQVTFINQASIPPRETYIFGIEVADVDRTAATLSALVGERQGRTVESNVSRERSGQVTGKLVYDVPMAKLHELIDELRAAGTVRVQRSAKHPEVPDSPLAVARVEVTLSNKELIVPSDEGIGASVRRGLSDSFKILAWSLRLLIFGLCILLPWALVIWAIYRLVVRMRRRAAPVAQPVAQA